MAMLADLGTDKTSVPEEDNRSYPLSIEKIYEDYAPRVYLVARRMLSSDIDAEDVTQDVLLQVLRKLPSFRGEAALPTWLHRITVNAALTHRRKIAVREENRIRDPFENVLENEQFQPAGRLPCSPDHQLMSQETRTLIQQAIQDLPEIYQEVLVLADIEGLPNAEVAERVGLGLPAMKSRLHRARQLLRQALAPYFPENPG